MANKNLNDDEVNTEENDKDVVLGTRDSSLLTVQEKLKHFEQFQPQHRPDQNNFGNTLNRKGGTGQTTDNNVLGKLISQHSHENHDKHIPTLSQITSTIFPSDGSITRKPPAVPPRILPKPVRKTATHKRKDDYTNTADIAAKTLHYKLELSDSSHSTPNHFKLSDHTFPEITREGIDTRQDDTGSESLFGLSSYSSVEDDKQPMIDTCITENDLDNDMSVTDVFSSGTQIQKTDEETYRRSDGHLLKRELFYTQQSNDHVKGKTSFLTAPSLSINDIRPVCPPPIPKRRQIRVPSGNTAENSSINGQLLHTSTQLSDCKKAPVKMKRKILTCEHSQIKDYQEIQLKEHTNKETTEINNKTVDSVHDTDINKTKPSERDYKSQLQQRTVNQDFDAVKSRLEDIYSKQNSLQVKRKSSDSTAGACSVNPPLSVGLSVIKQHKSPDSANIPVSTGDHNRFSDEFEKGSLPSSQLPYFQRFETSSEIAKDDAYSQSRNRNASDEYEDHVYDTVDDLKKNWRKSLRLPNFLSRSKDKTRGRKQRKKVELEKDRNAPPSIEMSRYEILLPSLQINLLEVSEFQKSCSGKKIDIDASKNRVIFVTTQGDFNDIKAGMFEKLSRVFTLKKVFPSGRCEFLKKCQNMQHVKELSLNKNLKVVFQVDVNESFIECHAFSEDELEKGFELIQNAFVTTCITRSDLQDSKSSAIDEIISSMQFPPEKVIVYVDEASQDWRVEGFDEAYVKETERNIQEQIERTIPKSSISIKLTGDKAKYFTAFLEGELGIIAREVNFAIETKPVENGLQISVHGDKNIVDDVHRRLGDIHMEEIDISSITNSDSDMEVIRPMVKDIYGYCDSFGKDNKCIVDFEEKNCIVEDVSIDKTILDDNPSKLTLGETSVELQAGSIASSKVDCLVNTVGCKKKLDEGVLSRAILQSGGKSLEQMFHKCVINNPNGSIYKTYAPGSLKCKDIYHVMLEARSPDCKKVIYKAIQGIMESVQDNYESIAFPPLGVGRMFGYPSKHVADAMLAALEEYLPFTTIKRVHLIIFHRDEETFDDIMDVFKQRKQRQMEVMQRRVQVQRPVAATITTETEAKCCNLKSLLVEDIKRTLLYDDKLTTKCNIYDALLNIANIHHVNVRPVRDGYLLRGFKYNVKKVLTETIEIIKEMCVRGKDPIANQEYKQQLSRCSMELVKLLATEEVCVPLHWRIFKPGYPLKELVHEKSTFHLVVIDKQSPEYSSIKTMVDKTWRKELVGHGRDVRGLDCSQFSKLKIVKIERVENVILYKEYALSRQKFFEHLMRKELNNFEPVEKCPNSSSSVLTQTCVSGNVCHLNNDLNKEVNEVYLFHGTKSKNVNAICEHGLDSRLASGKAMFGQGIYSSESSTKADQYSDDRDKRSFEEGEDRTMFLVRITLGRPYICTDQHPTKYRRPPCMSCYKDDCTNHAEFFDSVIGYNGKLFREFVTYDKAQTYPEYLITYNRV